MYPYQTTDILQEGDVIKSIEFARGANFAAEVVGVGVKDTAGLEAYDVTRASAEFVVLSSGEEYHGGPYQVTAQRLKNGKFDPKGEVINFYMDERGGRNQVLTPITVVRRLVKHVTFV